jgi:hypothetical protein
MPLKLIKENVAKPPFRFRYPRGTVCFFEPILGGGGDDDAGAIRLR